MAPLNIQHGYRYECLIGTGGIGSGLFFAMNGDHTLGREESRSGRYLDYRDYCKLHIISHYVKTLLGPGFTTIPIGKVGNDDAGRAMLAEMEETGMELRYVSVSPTARTLFSICFIYPDGSGGNLTPDQSACTEVDEAMIDRTEAEFRRFAGRGIALAAPEVSLSARKELLQLGAQYGFLRVASFVSTEIDQAIQMGLFGLTNLAAFNIHEAAMMAGIEAEEHQPEEIIDAALGILCKTNPGIHVSVTAGRRGSWSWDGENIRHVPAFQVKTVSTAGAGDAHIAGIMAGLAAGLELKEAQELGTLVAALSVTSPHTINPDVERGSLLALARQVAYPFSPAVWYLLSD